MKKILVTLLVLALVVPAMADVAITSAYDTGTQNLTISFAPSAGAVVRGIAVTVTVTGADVDAYVSSSFNTFVDYAFSTPGYTIGTGNPLALETAAGVKALPITTGTPFAVSVGYLDQGGAQAGLTAAGTVAVLHIANIAPAGGTVAVAANATRGGAVVGDTIGTVTVTGTTISSPSCTVSQPTLVKAVNPGFVNTDVTSVTASATSSAGHALEYSFNWGGGYGAYGAATQTNTYAFAAAGTETITVIARCTVDGSLSVASAPMVLTREAVKSTASFYADWKAAVGPRTGRMSCWAFKKQCKGDADGLLTGSAKTGYVAVYTADLTILSGAWNIKEPATGTTPAGTGLTNAQMCADFDHVATGSAKTGYVRVYTSDLTLLSTNWNIKEPATGTTPAGPGIGVCPASNVNFYTN